MKAAHASVAVRLGGSQMYHTTVGGGGGGIGGRGDGGSDVGGHVGQTGPRLTPCLLWLNGLESAMYFSRAVTGMGEETPTDVIGS